MGQIPEEDVDATGSFYELYIMHYFRIQQKIAIYFYNKRCYMKNGALNE